MGRGVAGRRGRHGSARRPVRPDVAPPCYLPWTGTLEATVSSMLGLIWRPLLSVILFTMLSLASSQHPCS
jgi:hypothetical protein